MKFIKNLPGLNSNKTWKKVLAIIYYIFSIIMLISSITTTPQISASTYDIIIHKISTLITSLALIIPPVLISISKTKLKDSSLKETKKRNNILGYIFIFLMLITTGGITNSFHTEDYQTRYQAYTEAQNSNSENDGIAEKEKTKTTMKELEDILDNLTSDQQEEQKNTVTSGNLLKIHYIDVGQGDSTFIELPNDETILIDAGESSESTTVANYINKLGHDTIDYLIGTHPHSDHIGGLADIVKAYEIENVYLPKAISTTKTYENLLTAIQQKGLTIKKAYSGVNIINTEDLLVTFVAPNRDTYSSLNNYSAVIKITYKDRSFLFMGDAETESENEIKSDIEVDVIRIGHHGSNTSSGQSFVNKVNPKYAIISVGTDNKYDHPHSEIVKRWEKIGASIYRTDEDGNILITSNGTSLTISSEKRTSIEDFTSDSNTETTNDSKKDISSSNNATGTPSTNNSTSSNNFTNSNNNFSNNGTTDNTNTNENNNSTNNNSNQTINLTNLTTSVTPGEYATISIKGTPNTEYAISVIYKSGPSKAKGLENKVSDANGNVSWNWKIGPNTSPGEYSITISDGNQNKTFKIKIEDKEG